MNAHTTRTHMVYRMAREVGANGTALATGVIVSATNNLTTTFRRHSGEVIVRDRWSGELLFQGTPAGWTRCAATTKTDRRTPPADIEADEGPTWIIELQNSIKEVAA